ncbi:MAG: hypothetical protein C0605_16535 [Hyphomicrobiales bacterium]|nr:MAG: hypothetical protein C0605_16535 [Hyphomicrobiales bacterium]
MRIKSCIGKNMQDALSQVRRQLGEDAIIISSFDRSDGSVELRAALDNNDAREDPFAGRLKARLEAETMPVAFSVNTRDEALPPPPHSNWRASQLRDTLINRGFPDRMRESLISTAIASERPDADAALAEALNAHFLFAPLDEAPKRPVMFIGPPGGGKTSLWAKAATRCVVAEQPIALMSLDAVRTGAAGQNAALAALLGVRSRLVKTPENFAAALSETLETHPEQPCLIDSPSANPYHLEEMELLAHFLTEAEKVTPIDKVLVLDGCTGGEDAADLMAAFFPLGIRAVALTKFDVARRYGGILAALFELGLPLGLISRTPYFLDGLLNPGAGLLAGLILEAHSRPRMTEIGNIANLSGQLKALGS